MDPQGRRFSVAVLTISDRCARGETPDTAGPALVELVERALASRVVATACVPDEAPAICARLREWSGAAVDLVLTTGGTGLAPRDVTPEATLAVLERQHPALLELARLRCFPDQPRAFLSRGVAGTIVRTLVINLPGSRRGSTECLRALLDVLPHALATLRGEAQHADERPSAPPRGTEP